MAAENGTVPAKTTGKASETTREYVVLIQTTASKTDADTSEWTVIGRPVAANDGDARKVVGSTLPADEKDAPLVAVPARYWKPKARKVKVTTSESWD